MSGNIVRGSPGPIQYVRFECSDGVSKDVVVDVARKMNYVRKKIEEASPSEGLLVQVKEIHGMILDRIVKFCTLLTEQEQGKAMKTDITRYEEQLLRVDTSTLSHIIKGADFLDVEPLLDVACKALAERIRGKTTEQLRESFGIVNDFTPEELEQVAQDNGWGSVR